MRRIVLLFSVAVLLEACQESLEQRCAREAREYTRKNCPAPVAKDVIVDSMTFDAATHTIGYFYTLSGQLDDTALVARNDMREMLLRELRNSAKLKMYKEADYLFRYVYYSKSQKGRKLFESTFRPSDYNE